MKALIVYLTEDLIYESSSWNTAEAADKPMKAPVKTPTKTQTMGECVYSKNVQKAVECVLFWRYSS
jgi:hypothetical protein